MSHKTFIRRGGDGKSDKHCCTQSSKTQGLPILHLNPVARFKKLLLLEMMVRICFKIISGVGQQMKQDWP